VKEVLSERWSLASKQSFLDAATLKALALENDDILGRPIANLVREA
jgi:hypothetical protein